MCLCVCVCVCVCVCIVGIIKSMSNVRLFATPWTIACQKSLSMGFPRQEYWSGLPFPSPGDLSFFLSFFPGDLSNSGSHPPSSLLAGRFFTAESLGKPIS